VRPENKYFYHNSTKLYKKLKNQEKRIQKTSKREKSKKYLYCSKARNLHIYVLERDGSPTPLELGPDQIVYDVCLMFVSGNLEERRVQREAETWKRAYKVE